MNGKVRGLTAARVLHVAREERARHALKVAALLGGRSQIVIEVSRALQPIIILHDWNKL